MRGITNARPKDGVQTINNLAPDGNGNFIIEAGTGVTITPGTNKITIDVAGGGGEWTKRSNNNNWTDIFHVNNSGHVVPSKDLMIYCFSGKPYFGPYFVPKDYDQGTSSFLIPTSCDHLTVDGTDITHNEYVEISNTRLTSSYGVFTGRIQKLTFNIDFDNKTFSVTSTADTINYSKSSFVIYTRD